MPTARESRLLSEFEGMKALRSRYCLFDFRCADLSAHEATGVRFGNSAPIRLEDFLTPEDFEQRYPGIAPAKYLVLYFCSGLERAEDGTIREVTQHAMEVIYGWHYPGERPHFIWLTPIWHPNFRGAYICIEGRPFAAGLTLAQIVPEVGRMIQYQNYNIKDPLNRDAADWAHERDHLFPVDERDILDSRRLIGGRQQNSVSPQAEPLFQIIEPERTQTGQLIELVNLDANGEAPSSGQEGV